MTASSTSDPPTNRVEGESGSSSGSGRRSTSALGLSIVSALNVLCLAFLVYHFAGHPYQPVAPPADPSSSEEAFTAMPEPIWTASRPGGNVDLAPASMQVLSIASGIFTTDRETERQPDAPAMTLATLEAPPRTPAQDNRPPTHWIQLGALSKEIAARRYWSSLKRRHAASLSGWEPRYFGPAEVGGSLHHIRLGPMTAEAASDLCGRLLRGGADCFCLNADAVETGISADGDPATRDR